MGEPHRQNWYLWAPPRVSMLPHAGSACSCNRTRCQWCHLAHHSHVPPACSWFGQHRGGSGVPASGWLPTACAWLVCPAWHRSFMQDRLDRQYAHAVSLTAEADPCVCVHTMLCRGGCNCARGSITCFADVLAACCSVACTG